jgi:hypothetical protein
MKPLVTQFLKNLGKSLHDLLTSKKFLAGVFTGIVQALPIEAHTKEVIAGIGMSFIVGQGIADFGKNRAAALPPAPPAP